MLQRIREERGLALMAVLTIIFVMALLSGLVLYLSGKEIALSAVRLRGAQGIFVAEGGAVSARSALMALMNADPIGVTTLDPSLGGTLLADWYAAGDVNAQNPFAVLDYFILDGQRFTLGATAGTASVTFHVNWGLAEPRRKLQVAAGAPPANPLGEGSYAATAVITRRAVAHASCTNGPCYVHRLGPDAYEYNFAYVITSDGSVPPQARRRVTFSRDFSIRVRRQTFAQFALFRNTTTTPSGANVWFINRDTFDGPVHTNSVWRFSLFPKFSDRLTSVNSTAFFANNGSAVQLSANENVVGGVRRDAPVQFDNTPADFSDDNDNLPANFTRGVAAIPFPTNVFSQKGVSIGRNPTDTTTVTNLQIRQAVPELPDNTTAVPTGIYVPVTDGSCPVPPCAPANGISDAGELLAGGIYVQGTLTGLTLSVGGASNNLAVYTLVLGTQTVTVTVDRVASTTTVTNTVWPTPQTRTFNGVPKGYQGPDNVNAAIIFVEGGIQSLNGTLEEKEQTTIAASGLIDITNHLRYEDPPVVTDPNDNPLNVLGVYSANNHIRFAASAPTELDIHAVLMAGSQVTPTFNSSVNTQNFDTKTPGTLHLIGGIIEEFSGPIGTFNASTGMQVSGYARDFRYDRRMSRGFSPPYFPTTNLFEIAQGTDPLAGVRPVWRESSP